jgi:3-methyl-2-oxobutanoate hydroxymethyltransferase
MPRVNINYIRDMKRRGEKITMITSYDYSTARIVDKVGIPLILVGDSLGMVVLGYENTLPVTMDVMLHHSKAVVRGTENALIVGDMPFMTYHVSLEDAMRNAGRFMQEAGTQAVKLEGGVTVAEKVRRIVECGIPVMGHIGLTPQSINQLGGHLVQGKRPEVAKKLVDDAISLQQAGAFAVVLESVPFKLAQFITEKVSIPTIGIGAGPYCDGQVQVINDTLGLFTDFVPKHAKQYAKLMETMTAALTAYFDEVKAGKFPTEGNSFIIDQEVIDLLRSGA